MSVSGESSGFLEESGGDGAWHGASAKTLPAAGDVMQKMCGFLQIICSKMLSLRVEM